MESEHLSWAPILDHICPQESWQSWAQSLIYNHTSQQHVNYQYHYSIHHYRHSLFTSDIYVVWNNLQIYSINCQWYYISPQQIITRLKKQIEIICLSSIKLNTFQYKISVLNLPPITPNLSAINSHFLSCPITLKVYKKHKNHPSVSFTLLQTIWTIEHMKFAMQMNWLLLES